MLQEIKEKENNFISLSSYALSHINRNFNFFYQLQFPIYTKNHNIIKNEIVTITIKKKKKRRKKLIFDFLIYSSKTGSMA